RLALELIKKISHSNESFITQNHTVKYFREELMDSELMHRKSWGEWVAQGSTSLNQRAHEKGKMILKNHKPDPLSEDVQKGMKKIIESAKSSIL
ncbi:MAG: trimethylamine methyltransferase family protein, partial [Candidatus Atribacteria bacterium]|nr:trimethylamine methyltransferase family protein [Candidatus Atribacteria bacterium]